MSTLRKNIAYKGLLTFSNYIIGFITFPYITRVLGPENFGLVNFVMNTVDFFLLFATMGITTIGTREIASARGNQNMMDTTFSKVLGLNLIFTIATLFIYFITVFTLPKLFENRELFYIGAAKILFTAFAVEWYFTGIENFRYITYRSLLVKSCYVVSVFILVKTSNDYVLYFSLTILSVIINSVINFIYSRRYVGIKLNKIFSKAYIKQNIRLGIYTIMTSLYITFNVMFLGLVNTDLEVGYYTTAVKLYFITISLFGAFTQVMMPRVSSLLSEGKTESVNNYLQKSFALVLSLSLPIIIFSEYFTPTIIDLMSGSGYAMSVTPMRILMPALLLVWISQVIALQALVPMRRDTILLMASIVGGCLSILVNYFITPKYGAIGSAITLLVCEFVVTSIYILTSYYQHLIILPSFHFWAINIIKSIPYIIICSIIIVFNNNLLGAGIAGILCCGYFFVICPPKMIKAI